MSSLYDKNFRYTPDAEAILSGLAEKGFASTNVVFGVGSYTYNYSTRDTFGCAIKATYAEVNGVGQAIFKDPVTDNGTKKSACGLLRVEKNKLGNYYLIDNCTWEDEDKGELQTVFLNGKVVKETTLAEIRARINEK